jgi:hypothetical protein
LRLLWKFALVGALAAVAAPAAQATTTTTYSVQGALKIPTLSGSTTTTWDGQASSSTSSGFWIMSLDAAFGDAPTTVQPDSQFNLTISKNRKVVGQVNSTFTGGTLTPLTPGCTNHQYAIDASLAPQGGGTGQLTGVFTVFQVMSGSDCLVTNGFFSGTLTLTS